MSRFNADVSRAKEYTDEVIKEQTTLPHVLTGLVSPYATNNLPTVFHSQALSNFESGWTADNGTIANESTYYRFGSQAMKQTSRSGASGQIATGNISVNLKDKLLLLDFYLPDSSKLSTIALRFQITATWAVYTIFLAERNSNGMFLVDGWNRL